MLLFLHKLLVFLSTKDDLSVADLLSLQVFSLIFVCVIVG